MTPRDKPCHGPDDGSWATSYDEFSLRHSMGMPLAFLYVSRDIHGALI